METSAIYEELCNAEFDGLRSFLKAREQWIRHGGSLEACQASARTHKISMDAIRQAGPDFAAWYHQNTSQLKKISTPLLGDLPDDL